MEIYDQKIIQFAPRVDPKIVFGNERHCAQKKKCTIFAITHRWPNMNHST